MEPLEHVARLRRHGDELAAAANRSGLDAAVPTCPDWSVRDLLAHVSGVHRWARSFVATGRQSPATTDEDGASFERVADERLLSWYLEGLDDLVATLSSADPSVSCWTFLPAPSPLAFWARRQAHETAIHAADASLAAGGRHTFDAAFAVDGVDELLYGFYSRPRTRLADGEPFSLSLRATDSNRAWTVRVDGSVRVEEGADGSCVLEGAASDCYAFAWNRAPASTLTVKGDRDALTHWSRRAHVTWS